MRRLSQALGSVKNYVDGKIVNSTIPSDNNISNVIKIGNHCVLMEYYKKGTASDHRYYYYATTS